MNDFYNSIEIIRENIQDLFSNQFMTTDEYKVKVESGYLVKMKMFESDYVFQEKHPDHPLASDNRFARIRAADKIRDIAKEINQQVTDDVLDDIHRALFDCSATVRHSLAIALFYIGSHASTAFLNELLSQEKDSKLICEAARSAIARCTMRNKFSLLSRNKLIILISKDLELMELMLQISGDKGYQLYMPDSNFIETITRPCALQIFDRSDLGKEAWDAYCEYLRNVNDESDTYPIMEEKSEDQPKESTYDHSPLIIVDKLLHITSKEYQDPIKPIGRVFHLGGTPIDLIEVIANKLLDGQTIDFVEVVNEVNRKRGIIDNTTRR